jgi:hypothetical protein
MIRADKADHIYLLAVRVFLEFGISALCIGKLSVVRFAILDATTQKLRPG